MEFTLLKEQRGIYNIDNEKLELYGNVIVTSTKGEKLNADKIVYDNKTKFITAYGEKKDLLYVSNNGELRSREFRYNNETQEAFADKKYDFKSLKYDSTGREILF